MNTPAVWLVKSGDKILGPFTAEEVLQRLRTKEIVVIDEVVTPMSRWRVLRDEPQFKSAVEEIRRGQMSAREDTEIQGHTAGGVTNTVTDQDLDRAVAVLASETAEPISPQPADTTFAGDALQVKDAEFVDAEPMAPAGRAVSRSQVRQYGVRAENELPKIRAGFNFVTMVWVVAAIVVFVTGYLFWHGGSETQQEAAGSPHDFERLVVAADKSWQTGDFANALNLYRQANQIKPGRPEVVARLAPLLIHLEAQTVNAKRSLSETLASGTNGMDPALKGDLENGLGLAALSADDFNEAETWFHSAMKDAPASIAARFNYAMVAYQAKDYLEAARRFTDASREPAGLLMEARSIIAADHNGKSVVRKQAEAALNSALEHGQDFRQEAILLSAVLALDEGDKKVAATQVRAALDIDPDLTNEHRHDPYLFLEPLGWRALVDSCRKLSDELKVPAANAMLGLCLFKAGNREEASQVISSALAESPEEPYVRLLQSVNAYIMAVSGRLEDARAALKLASQGDVPKLANFVRARICLSAGDTGCAEQVWRDLASENPPPLAALTGLAEIRIRQHDPAKALELIDRARRMSPSYAPALNLREGLKP